MPLYFTKDELEMYLNNAKRIVNIVVHVSFDINDGIVGDIIEE